VAAIRYRLIQPDAPPPLRGALYTTRPYAVGDFLSVPRRDGSPCFWKVVAVEDDPDPEWTGVLRCGFADPSEWPELPADYSPRPATDEDFARWRTAAEQHDEAK
jgi:hypothetical protein